jgi:hypothetical protein
VRREKSRPEQVEVFSEPGGLKVFRNPDAYPRAWVVRKVIVPADRRAAAELVQSPDFDARRETFLLGGKQRAPSWEACDGDATVDVVVQEIHRVAARARTACGGMVVFGDPIFPGWQARVDGKPAPLYAAYGALRGVVVPAGDHFVELLYRPRSVYLGAALSGIGFAGCLMLAAAAWRESRKWAGPGGP